MHARVRSPASCKRRTPDRRASYISTISLPFSVRYTLSMPSRRVLLVEDEPGLVMTLTDRLVSEGYEVESTGDAVNGLARATEGAFDAILLDVMLPGGNGFDVCR